jgi:hypothetical protein
MIALTGFWCSAAAPLHADLVAHWKLDEGEGEEFEDSAGGNDGFLPDGMTVEWNEGPPTQEHAVRFLGLDSFIATDFPGIGGHQPRTVAFWLKTADPDAYMLGWGSNSEGRKWHIRLNMASGVLRTEFAGGQNYATLPINDGEWHHVASVFPEGATEGFQLLHYVDGVLDWQSGGMSIPIDTAVGDGSADWSDGASTGSYYVHFGAVLAHGFGRMLDGSMADVRIYDEELDEEEIQAIMEGEPPEPDPVRFVRGDADADGQVSITDGIVILRHLFQGAAPPACLDAADVTDSGGATLLITDAIVIFRWLFQGEEAPPPPSPSNGIYPASDCGADPTDDALDCETTAATCAP